MAAKISKRLIVKTGLTGIKKSQWTPRTMHYRVFAEQSQVADPTDQAFVLIPPIGTQHNRPDWVITFEYLPKEV